MSGWRLVFGIITRWEGRELYLSDAITTLGNNKVASLLLLSVAKVSSTKDLLNRQTCQRILCLHLVTSQMVSSAGLEPAREITMGFLNHSGTSTYSNSSWQCTPCCRLWLCAARRGPRPSARRANTRRESHGRGRPRPPPQPLLLLPRRSLRYQSRPTATAQSLWELLSYDFRLLLATRRLHLQS